MRVSDRPVLVRALQAVRRQPRPRRGGGGRRRRTVRNVPFHKSYEVKRDFGGRRCDVASQNIIYSTYRKEQRVFREGPKERPTKKFSSVFCLLRASARRERRLYARNFLFLGALFRPCGCSVLAVVPFSRLFRFRGRFVLTLLQSRARSGIPAVWPECPGAAGGDRIYRFWKSKAEVLSGRVRFSPGFTQTAASRHSTTSG